MNTPKQPSNFLQILKEMLLFPLIKFCSQPQYTLEFKSGKLYSPSSILLLVILPSFGLSRKTALPKT